MKPHLFLNNPRGESKVFNVARIIEEDDEDNIPEKEAPAYRLQKETLNVNLSSFLNALGNRRQQRTLQIPDHIDYILVNFFPVFNNSEDFKTRTRFEKEFGLVAVSYHNFNQSVLFAIADNEKFEHFLDLLRQFVASEDNIHPNGQAYHILTLIHSFSFLNLEEELPADDAIKVVILGLTSPAPSIGDRYSSIFTSLLDLLEGNTELTDRINYNTDYQTSIEIKDISRDVLNLIIRNYDIIQTVQSLRIPTIRQNAFNQPELTWDLVIDPPTNKSLIIGVVDNGVRRIRPLENIIIDRRIDVTNRERPNPLQATHPHGTIVATLAAIGERYFDPAMKRLDADAMIMPIKILNFETGLLNIYDIREAIQRGIEAGVKIFTLSVCGPGKMYNEPQSDYAYLLDKLTFDNDILILIATGNLEEGDVQAMQDAINGNPAGHFHTYPNHFYNPYEATPEHDCEATNICMPSESLNNMTVGAIADNKKNDTNTSLTPFKELAAYYTRKWHLDYSRKVNGRTVAKKQTNHNIHKPDIVMAGGDLLNENSRMQVIGFGENGNDFYSRESGTSLAVPLAANLAVKIVGEYPSFTMQSVKALMINSSSHPLKIDFLDDLITKVRNETAIDNFGRPFADLSTKEKIPIRTSLSAEKLYGRIAGFGIPSLERAIYSDSKRVTIVIQDTIALESHKVIKLNIPEYLLRYTKTGPLLHLKATLCFKFKPVPNNQLGYNPLHISFNIYRDISRDPGTTARIVSDKQNPWYNRFTIGLEDEKERAAAKNKALAIKTNPKAWSEDFFPTSSKPFSNTQQFEIKINKAEIRKASNQVSIAVRCTYKRDLPDFVLDDLKRRSHDFSIVLEVAERPNRELGNFDLYDELVAINELDIYPIQTLEAEGEDLHAEV